MKNSLILSFCGILLIAFTGCSSLVTPKGVKITAVEISSYPNTNNGLAWDLLDGPDLTFAISNGNSSIYTDTNFYGNISSDNLPLTMSVSSPFLLPSIEQEYTLQLFDKDEIIGNTLMGEATFNPKDHSRSKPEKISFSSSTISGSITLEWVLE